MIGMAAIMRDVTRRFEEMRALKRKLAEVAALQSSLDRGRHALALAVRAIERCMRVRTRPIVKTIKPANQLLTQI
jgi:hypothetical protein